MMDMVRGREISREAQWLADNIGSQVIASILRCAQFAPPVAAAAFKSMAKYWIQAEMKKTTSLSRPRRDPLPPRSSQQVVSGTAD